MPVKLEIESLRIKRFKRFQDFTASFSRPVTIIFGNKWYGKIHIIASDQQLVSEANSRTWVD